jgi:hypothetical protein
MSNQKNTPIAWAHHATFDNLNNLVNSRFTATLSKKETNACCIALYTKSQRTWVGLTEAQCGVLWKVDMTPFIYYQAIEAKLKEKNGL